MKTRDPGSIASPVPFPGRRMLRRVMAKVGIPTLGY
jgi:hypothetical protein